MIYLPKDIPAEPGCIIRDVGATPEGTHLYQSILWVNGIAFASLVRSQLGPPSLSDLQKLCAHFPSSWSPIALKPTA